MLHALSAVQTLRLALIFFSLQTQGTLTVEVRSESGPVTQAEIVIREEIAGVTDSQGIATLQLPAGEIELTIQRYGFASTTVDTFVTGGETRRITVELESESVLNEEIFVTATRSDVRIEDEPLRVEVVGQEEIDEKATMTPGDIAMLLNETNGLRVQVTSPSLGAANVRVQGLRGRYTQLLSDGLPLYGGQTGTIGILQIPPLDLGQVEVIKGVASALYGSSAGGTRCWAARTSRSGTISTTMHGPILRNIGAAFSGRVFSGMTSRAVRYSQPPVSWPRIVRAAAVFSPKNSGLAAWMADSSAASLSVPASCPFAHRE